jgi:protein gp37
VSEGCRHCYAETLAGRFSEPGQWGHGLATRTPKGARWTGRIDVAADATFLAPLRWKRPRRIFVNSLSDLFHDGVPDAVIDRVFAVMALSPQHTFQLLTKRPERMLGYLDKAIGRIADAVQPLRTDNEAVGPLPHIMPGAAWWPLPNVWLGVSVEDQAAADARIPLLLATPAAKRFLSCEPLLGPVTLDYVPVFGPDRERLLHWVIAGGESGPGARPMHPGWVRQLRDQCAAAGVPFFFKQWGEWAPLEAWEPWDRTPQVAIHLDGQQVDDMADDWPADAHRLKRIGKKRAGNLLDGRQHLEWPE